MTKIKIRYRRAYPYRCLGCDKRRETKIWSRYVKKICTPCRRSKVVPGQKAMFGDIVLSPDEAKSLETLRQEGIVKRARRHHGTN